MASYRPAPSYNYTHISTATTTTITTPSAGGQLHSIVVNTVAAGTITVNDGLGGTTIAILSATAGPGTFTYDVDYKVGLSIITGAASDITVCWR